MNYKISYMTLRSPLTLGAIYLLGAAALCAQAAPVAARAANGAPEDVVTLEEFQVTTSKTNDYLAAESVTGTRVATSLRDLPFAVNVVTSEFIKDFAAFEFPEQVAFVSSVSPNEVQGQYQIRGFLSDAQLVDNFRRLGLIDPGSVDRIEVIKGPAASVYGRVSPGGVVNIITNKPKSKPEQNISVSAGSEDFRRASAYSTGPVGQSNQLFYRVAIAGSSRAFEQQFDKTTQYYGNIQFAYKFDPDTSLSLSIDHSFRHEIRLNPLPTIRKTMQDPYRNPGRTYSAWLSLDYDLFHFNYMGPEEFNDRRMTSATTIFEHRYNQVWSTRASASWFNRDFKRLWVSGGQLNADTGKFNPQSPEWDDQPQRGTSAQVDTLAQFTTGPIANKLLFTIDYNEESDRVNKLRMNAAAVANPALNPIGTLDPNNPNFGFVTYQQDPTLYTNNTENDYQTTEDLGVFVSERATMFDDRLNLLIGGRYDNTANELTDYLGGTKSVWKPKAYTYQAGLNYKIIDAISLFGSQSSSFSPQPQTDINNNPLPNEKGKGWEAGFKVVSWQNRINLTASYFDIDRRNILANFTDPQTGKKLVVLSGRENARGYETDFNVQLTEGFQVFGGYGHVKARVLESQDVPFSVGTSPRRVPADAVAVGGRYEIKSGALKGLYFTVDERYNSETRPSDLGSGRTLTPSASNPVINNPMPNGVLPYPDLPVGTAVTDPTRKALVNDGRESIMNGAWATLGASVGYRWKTRGGLRERVQVNVKNFLDRKYTYAGGVPGDPITVIAGYSVTF